MTLSFARVGSFITVKRPGNLVGWALTLAGFALLFGFVLAGYAELAVWQSRRQDSRGRGGSGD